MGLAVLLAGKGVEDAEYVGRNAQRKPDRGGGFLVGHLQAGGKEIGHCLLLARFGNEPGK